MAQMDNGALLAAACFVISVAGCASIRKTAPAEPTVGVLFRETFESRDWFVHWGMTDIPRNTRNLRDPTAPSRDKAVVRVFFPRGRHFGAAWNYRMDPPRDEVYMRYYVKFEKGFDFGRGGKTPGLMGWAPDKHGGWGGRRVDGTNAFSTRICWGRGAEINMYTYHADQHSNFGNSFHADVNGGPARWEAGRWYCMELHMKLNTPGRSPGKKGKKDGLIELWCDGKLIGRHDDVRFRHVPELKIDRLFVNAYFGGWRASPRDQAIYYDDFVLSNEYIGPVDTGRAELPMEPEP